jgi:cyanophycinase-like exopeptidase
VTGKGKAYLIGSGHGPVVREVFRRVEAELPPGPIKVATTLAALERAPSAAHGHTSVLANFTRAGTTVTRFGVAGESFVTAKAEAEAVVAAADVIFFGGGDPVLVAQRLNAAGADGWIRAARQRGAICVGLSAGSIALGAYWASWPDDEPDALAALVPGLGVIPDLVVDCHAEADDWEELRLVRARLGAQADSLRFAGIGHGSALIVDGAGGLEWIGKPALL